MASPNTPFLETLAKQLASEFGTTLGEVTVVFPNRRAGLFFRKYLAQHIQKPIWSPEILSIEDFFDRLSPLRIADPLTQVFALYQAFREAQSGAESFDKFYYWGEVLLRDFEEVDKYLVNPDDLFYMLKAQKDLESRYSYLTEEQQAVIKAFWQSYQDQENAEERDFGQVWERLAPVYHRFGETLEAEGLTYEGRQHRYVAEAAKAGALENPFSTVVFAGFNALTGAEERLLKHFVTEHRAQVVWDVDSYYLNDPQQEAGDFLRKYKEDRTLGAFFPDPLPDRLRHAPEEVTLTGVPLAVGQAKALGQHLESLMQQPGFDPERTVVVLPDEGLLFPVLHSLPEALPTFNVTMGYPLRQTLLYAFLEHLLALQQNRRSTKQYTLYPHRHLLALLRHPFLKAYNADVAHTLASEIERKNRLWINADELRSQNAFYKVLFAPLTQEDQLFDYLLENLRYVRNHLPEHSGEIESEYLYQFYLHINRLRDVTREQKLELKLDTLLRLFRTLIRSLRIPFSGEPLNGLQIMGVLETRNLDFDHVFMLSMNEEMFPSPPNRSSFIPYNLRKGFELPTFEQSDSVAAYLFYRLLHQAKQVHLYYNTEDTSQMKGEPSRFLHQLRYESGWDTLKERVLAHPMELSPIQPITITKSPEVLARMARWRPDQTEPVEKGLTPSALSVYLACRLQFYFKYIASLKESEEVEEVIDARLFGNILHNALEQLYTDFWDQKQAEVNPEDFTWLRQHAEACVNEQFGKEFGLQKHETFTFEGRNILVKEVILQLVHQILNFDAHHAPFELVGLEQGSKEDDPLHLDLPLAQGGTVRIEGIIDRVDRKNGQIRVIDYKTGRDDKRVPSVASLFDRESKKRNKAAFQTFLYGLLYREKTLSENIPLVTGLYNAREMFTKDFQPYLSLGQGREVQVIDDFAMVETEYKTLLKELLSELFDSETPFDQTEDRNTCQICSYAAICHRDTPA